MSWDAKLARPLKPINHAPLRTLADARDYMLALPPAIAEWQAWHHAGKLLLAAATIPTKTAISAATDQVGTALFLTYREGLSKPRSPSQ